MQDNLVTLVALLTAWVGATCAASPESPLRTFDGGSPRVRYEYVIDERGDTVKQGSYERWHKNGTLAAQGWYSDNQRDSTWRTWLSNGHRDSVSDWRNGVLDGYCRTYEIGPECCEYRNGTRHGQWWSRYAYGRYVDGLREGHWEERFHRETSLPGRRLSDYNCMAQGAYVNGKREGYWMIYCRWKFQPPIDQFVRYHEDTLLDTVPRDSVPHEILRKWTWPWPPETMDWRQPKECE